jgi:hypothetical protein
MCSLSAFVRSGCATFVFLVPALLTAAPQAQTSAPDQKPVPAITQAPPGFSPPVPHTNAPLGDIPHFPGDGNGAYKTHQYRDLFAEQGHPAEESRAKIEKSECGRVRKSFAP